ncbi:hypothetical protein BpHYR1_011330 [Brachionus plicatilis]|uniref:Uncharacterized protein n=1 Tax=Brachionus plicatilis TaxID=10195 RepID=A0A3M7SKF1_BRAPC|nr:hypothetical protein BpHYR1_011330 [Brachionus plicatilis]
MSFISSIGFNYLSSQIFKYLRYKISNNFHCSPLSFGNDLKRLLQFTKKNLDSVIKNGIEFKTDIDKGKIFGNILASTFSPHLDLVESEANSLINKMIDILAKNGKKMLSERYVRAGLSHSVPVVVRLVEEYREGFESRYIEYPTPLSISSVQINK